MTNICTVSLVDALGSTQEVIRFEQNPLKSMAVSCMHKGCDWYYAEWDQDVMAAHALGSHAPGDEAKSHDPIMKAHEQLKDVKDTVDRLFDTEEVITTSSTGGQKGVKPARFDLIPPEALFAIAEHYGKGAEKYEDHQWLKGYEWSKSFAAAMRHLWAFWGGENFDAETGTLHLAAAAFHINTLIVFFDKWPEHDDRPFTKGFTK